MKTHTLYLHGMHCNACVVLTQAELEEHTDVEQATSSLTTQTVTLTVKGNLENMPPEALIAALSSQLSKHTLSLDKPVSKTNWKELGIASLITAFFILAFLLLQRAGVVSWVNADSMNYGTAFFIGVIASLSTCMAVVGGVVLSMSATFAQSGDKVKPQLLFHASRLISFFLLGGAIGAAGAVFKLGSIGTFALSAGVALVMLMLGINLLDLGHWSKKVQLSMPKFMAQKTRKLTQINHTLTPALVGAATFFLPCGFTQSMQVYTLSTGSFLSGGLTMLTFALGTFPVLALISFSSVSIGEKKRGIFFKTAGLLVILFALFNLLNSFAVMGWISPLFNF